MQWKSQGVADKKAELMGIISQEKSNVLCIQETMPSSQTNFNSNYYNGLLKEGYTSYWAHGEVAVFIHKITSYQNLPLMTPVQAIAARFTLIRDVTIVPTCNSRSRDISEKLLSTLLQLQPKPVILKGDFNTCHQIWGNQLNDKWRSQVLNLINKTN